MCGKIGIRKMCVLYWKMIGEWWCRKTLFKTICLWRYMEHEKDDVAIMIKDVCWLIFSVNEEMKYEVWCIDKK